jgi:hypothetical protein
MSFMGVPAASPMYCRARSAAALAFSSPKSSGDRYLRRQRDALAGVGAPGDERLEGVGLQVNLDVEDGVVVRAQRVPVVDGGVPLGALRRVRAALHVGVGGLVRSHHAGAGACFDRHVADGHPGVHRERADGRAAVLQDVALAAAGPDLGDDGKDNVLGGHAGAQRALDVDGHGLEGLEGQRLGGHDVLHLGRADAHGQRTERAVRGRVRVAAHHGHSGLGQSQLRTHNVHDALLGVTEGMQADTELLAVVAQGLDLGPAGEVGDRLVDVQRRGVVVLGGDGEVRAAQLAAGQAETLEGLRGGHLMDEVEVDVQKVRLGVGAFAVAFAHHVRIPDFLGQCFGHGHLPSMLFAVGSTETADPCNKPVK